MGLNFEILIDDFFEKICTLDREKYTPINNKKLLSLINDFEEGSWRYSKFNNFIWDNIVETALSSSERSKLVGNDLTRLKAAAKNISLTKNIPGRGSELSEILLYGIMKHHYDALSVVPKIFHKQNSQDNAKGVDSVHIAIEGENDFSLWFGEAKFFNKISAQNLADTINSVEKSLQTDNIKKENRIITNINDLEEVIQNKELLSKIKSLLYEQESIDNLKPKLHIPILLLYECEKTKAQKEMSEKYRQNIIDDHKKYANKYYSKQISKLAESVNKYSSITFHLILFPVPNKQKIVDEYINNVEFFKK